MTNSHPPLVLRGSGLMVVGEVGVHFSGRGRGRGRGKRPVGQARLRACFVVLLKHRPTRSFIYVLSVAAVSYSD